MEQINLNPGKKWQIRIATIATLALMILSFLWIFFHLYAFLEMKTNPSAIGSLDNGIGTGFIIRILLYISFAALLLKTFAGGLKTGALVIFSVSAGVVSAISIVFDWAALVDIYHDYPNGIECKMEWNWLFFSLAIQLVFCILGLILVFKIMKTRKTINSVMEPVVDETVFEITQYVGIVCGFAGLVFTALANVTLREWDLKHWLIRLILFYCLAIILPWFTLVVYRLVRLTRKAETTLYDEKQKQDMARSGLIAWLVSIPVMTVIFIFNYVSESFATGFLWLPYYLFSTLLVFSLSLLVKYKKG
ncbi:MAG: hypothetical protein WAV93_00445 [Bacteroidales bacterium]